MAEEVGGERLRDKFRLWLTAAPCPELPRRLLHAGVKVNTSRLEPYRAQVGGSLALNPWAGATEEELQVDHGIAAHHVAFARRAGIALAVLHACVMERSRHAEGWKAPYGFSPDDAREAVGQCAGMLREAEGEAAHGVVVRSLRHLLVWCAYGGRLTEEGDRALLDTVCRDYLDPCLGDDPSLQGEPP